MEIESNSNQLETEMDSHTIQCLLCRAVSTVTLLKPTFSNCETIGEEEKNELYNNWAKSCIESITRMLQIHEVNSNFLNASYCVDCIQLMRDINFTLIQLDNFQNKIITLRQELLSKLSTNYNAVPNKCNISYTYADVQHLENPYHDFTTDEIVKMVYEKIEESNPEYMDLDLMKPINNHSQSHIQIQSQNSKSELINNNTPKNNISKSKKVIKIENQGRSQRQRKIINYNEDEIQVKQMLPMNSIKDEEFLPPDIQHEDYHSEYISDPESNNSHISTNSESRLNISDYDEDYIVNEPIKKNANFRCPVIGCRSKFVLEDSLLIHQRKVHEGDPQPYECKTCSKKYKSGPSLSAHIKLHNTGGEHSVLCQICNKSFISKTHLEKHMNRIHTNKYPMCSFCDIEFKLPNELIEHENLHKINEQPFKCIICNVIFTNSMDLKKHSRSHSNKYYICDTCGISLSNDKSLKKHSRIHEPNYIGHKCHVCSHVFQSKSVLERHMLKHSNEKKFICEICGVSFRYNSDLKLHSRKHDGIYPFICKICCKSFISSTCLKNHEEIHSGILSYECSICSKKFRTKHNLHQHLNSHKPKNINANIKKPIGIGTIEFNTEIPPPTPQVNEIIRKSTTTTSHSSLPAAAPVVTMVTSGDPQINYHNIINPPIMYNIGTNPPHTIVSSREPSQERYYPIQQEDLE